MYYIKQRYLCVISLSFLEDIEALLFGFQSIADTVDVSYSDVIPGLIGLIPRITANNVQLAETIMFTIGTPIHF